MQKLSTKTGIGGSAGVTGLIDAVSEVLVLDIEDLVNVTLIATQVVDNGTVTLDVEVSPDGVTWFAFGTALTEASFAAGENKSVSVSLSDTNGMPLVFKQARIATSVYTGTGTYSFKACGLQRESRY